MLERTTTILTKQIPIPGAKNGTTISIDRRLAGWFFVLFWALQFIGRDYLAEAKILYRGSMVETAVGVVLFFAPLIIAGVFWTPRGPEKILEFALSRFKKDKKNV